nr:hypothetical protein [Tanacetum cinerariifolium]
MSSDSHAAITYTSMLSYEVIVNGYYGMPMDPLDPYVKLVMEAPPSPDYIPRPEAPPSTDYIPRPEAPPSPDYIPGPKQIRPALTIADRRRADDRLIGILRRERRYFRTLSTTYAQEKMAPKRTTRSTQVSPVTPAPTTTTTTVTEAQLQALIDQGVAVAMAEAEASRVRNGYSSNGSGPRLAQVVHECTYLDFLKFQWQIQLPPALFLAWLPLRYHDRVGYSTDVLLNPVRLFGKCSVTHQCQFLKTATITYHICALGF